MAVVGFVLECAAIAALLGTGLSVLALLAICLPPAFARRISPRSRADLAFVGGVLPAILATAGTAAAAVPSLVAAFGLGSDHCHRHSHHLHVCFVHSTMIRADVAALGALALAVWIFRAGSLVRHGLDVARDVRRLERLGTAHGHRFPIVEVPGNAPFCHAVGWLRGRILVGSSLAARLDACEMRCALAHERAHLRRRDPLASLLLAVAGLFMPPPVAKVLQRAYRNAAEEACDDEAACAVGDGALVAGSLVAVARVQQDDSWRMEAAQVFAFGEHRLETRVRRLLAATSPADGRPCALPVASGIALLVFAAAMLEAPFVHHAVETALHLLF